MKGLFQGLSLLAAVTAGCDRSAARTESTLGSGRASTAALRFVDVTQESGVDVRHLNGAEGELWMAEVIGAGAGVFDCDGDGDLDLLLRQGGALPGATGGRAGVVAPGAATDRLFRNDSAPTAAGRSRWRFTDVTSGSGFDRAAYGMGIATGDIDNDGRTDVYLTNYGPNRMLRASGDCRYEDVTSRAGVDDARWSTAASFLDFDRDGDLDLFVGNYLDFTAENRKDCFQAAGGRDYCGPDSHTAVPSRLFENLGNGSFRDVTVSSGLAQRYGKTLGSVVADFDGDRWPDLFVANDSTENLLWRNRGDGTFEESAQILGCALNAAGQRTGDMGVDAADFDDDGDVDLLATHLSVEGLSMWRNDGAAGFSDIAAATRTLSATLGLTGFGALWFDPDLDGSLDIAIVNGGVRFMDRLEGMPEERSLAQPRSLLRKVGKRYEDVSAESGFRTDPALVGRALVAADLDNDGDPDLVVTNNGGPAQLMRNESSDGRSWVGLRLLAAESGRDALGATVELVRLGHPVRMRQVSTDGSYLSARDPRVLFGLRDAAEADSLRVNWPSGRSEEFRVPALGRYTTLSEGTGVPAADRH